jgi:hypothetical protein
MSGRRTGKMAAVRDPFTRQREWRWLGFCPLHEWERAECTRECAAVKDEMRRINESYAVLWFDRRRGVRPMDPLEFRLRQSAA